jgi:hypothetical protein
MNTASQAHDRIERLKYELGDMLVRFAHLDWLVTFAATALMQESPDVCIGILSELSFRKKVDVLKTLFQKGPLPPEIAAGAKKVLRLVYRSEEGRNRLVHTTWLAASEEKAFRLKPSAQGKAGFDFGFRQIAEDEVKAATLSIQEAITALSDYTYSLQEQKLLRFNIVKK